jgi:ribonuclease VapC
MFVDASALVAILAREDGYERLTDCLDACEASITSALAIFETASAIARKKNVTIDVATQEVQALIDEAAMRIVSLGEDEGEAALQAFARYGKGRGHPAQLNMGDCFAHACARTHGVPLLFVGNDFIHTDIPSVLD